MKLTAKVVERIKHEPVKGRQYDIKDDLATGLYLRLSVSGRKAFVHRYKLKGKQRVLVLGEVANPLDTAETRTAASRLTLAEARQQAAIHTAAVARGDDPAGQRQKRQSDRRRMPTVEEFGQEYLERHAKPNKKTWKDDQEALKNWIYPKIGRIKMMDVNRRDIVAVIDAVRERGYKRQPGIVLAIVRRMFRFAVERGVLDSSPCIYITERQPPAARKAMTEDQIRKWWGATGEAITSGNPIIHKPSALALRLLLLTGQRPGEVAGLRVEELNLDAKPEDGGPVWKIPPERRKRNKPQSVALTPEAVKVIESALPYAVNGQVFARVRARPQVDNCTALRTDSGLAGPLRKLLGEMEARPTPHSARHTVATELAQIGFDELEIALVLGHQSRSVTGMVYINRRSLVAQRKLLETWERRLLAIVEDKVETAEVVSFR